MSRPVFTLFIQRYLTDTLQNVRNTMIVTAQNYQGHIDTLKPIAKRLQSLNTGQVFAAPHTSLDDAFLDWEARKPLLNDGSRHGDGEGLVAIIDGYISAVEGASHDADNDLDNRAYNAHFTKNCMRRMLGLTDQYGDDEFTHLDANMPTVTIEMVVDQGSGAFDAIETYLNHHLYVQPVPVPGPGNNPSPPQGDLHSPRENDYVNYEKDAVRHARDWADKINSHQMGFIGRLQNVDTYRQHHTINRNAGNQESQANIYNDIAKQYHDQTLVNAATGQTNTKAHPAIKIATIRYDDGSTGIVVELAGIDGSEGYPGANVLPGGIFAGAGWGYLTDYYRDVKQAISDYCKRMGYNENTIPMTFEGHSLGGIIAQQLADTSNVSPSFPPGIQFGDAGQFGSSHNIREVVTMGSPNMLSSYNDNTRVSLYTDLGDIVPLLSPADTLTTLVTDGASLGLLNPFTSTTGRAIDTWGETVVDQGNVSTEDPGASHGAYGQSADLQATPTDFVIPDPKSTYYYTSPVGTNTPQQVYTNTP